MSFKVRVYLLARKLFRATLAKLRTLKTHELVELELKKSKITHSSKRIVEHSLIFEGFREGLKINVGCETNKREGYVNVDIRPEVELELVADVENELLSRFEDGSAQEIFCKDFVKDCSRVLKPRGRFEDISYWVYGGQEYSKNYHKAGFTRRSLESLLSSEGFRILKMETTGTSLMCWAEKVAWRPHP